MKPQCFPWQVACLAVMFCGLSAAAADKEVRTWTDSTGQFKIQASFVGLENNKVTLLREGGQELEIDLKKLSDADQKFIAEAMKAAADNPFKAKADDPFKAKPKVGTTTSAAPKAPAEPRNVTVDWSGAQQVALGPPSDKWQVQVAAAAGFASQPKTAALPKKTGFFEKLSGLAINAAANKAAVGYTVADPRPTGVTRLVLCDLATGRTSPPATAPGLMIPIAVHDDGQQILMRREDFGFGNQDRLEVWTIDGSNVAKHAIWTPYGDVQGGGRDVLWAEFLDTGRLATSSRAGKVTIWAYPEIRPLVSFSLADGAVPALSPDRRWIAYCNGTDVGLFDVAKGEVMAQQPTPEKLQWPYLAFSPSGKRLACIAFDKVLAWDVASGKLERTVPCPGLHVHGGIDFPDENSVLANDKFLIDLESQLKLWTYEGQEQAQSVAGWTFFGITDGDQKPGALIATQIPHPAAKDLLKKALSSPDLFVLKKGTTVKLDLSGIPDAGQHQFVTQSLAKRLQAIGCTVGANGTIDLMASMEGPKERKISYFSSGDYTVQEYRSKVKFVYRGQPVWETSGTNVPFIITLKSGENIGSHLKEREKPDYAFFERVELPKLLQKPAAGNAPGAGGSLTLGQSRLSASGIR